MTPKKHLRPALRACNWVGPSKISQRGQFSGLSVESFPWILSSIREKPQNPTKHIPSSIVRSNYSDSSLKSGISPCRQQTSGNPDPTPSRLLRCAAMAPTCPANCLPTANCPLPAGEEWMTSSLLTSDSSDHIKLSITSPLAFLSHHIYLCTVLGICIVCTSLSEIP
jgi:hypothetical protein